MLVVLLLLQQRAARKPLLCHRCAPVGDLILCQNTHGKAAAHGDSHIGDLPG